jgi:hypothetical protein
MSKAQKHVVADENGVAIAEPAQTEHNDVIVSALSKLVDKVESMTPPIAKVKVYGDGKHDRVNTKGETLMADFTLAKKTGAPDPLCVTINEEFFWIKRGVKVQVPFYLVFHLRNNIETHYVQEKDEQGKNIIKTERMPAEAFSYSWIDPAPGQANLDD